MLQDPKAVWDDARFPYEVMAEVGITPDSSIRDVQNAYFQMIEKGMRSSDSRAAWDALKTIPERLWVDFLMHPLSIEALLAVLAERSGAVESSVARQDAGDIHIDRSRAHDERLAALIAEFDPPQEELLAGIEFDS